MSDLRLVLIQTGYQLVSVARNRRAVVFSLVFPIVLLVMFNSVFVKGSDTVELNGATINAHTYFTGSMLAYAILLAGFNSLAITLVMQRESGQLKRLRGTPVPAWTFMVATVLRCVATVGLMTIVLLAIGHFAYDVPIAGSAVGDLLLYVVLGIVAMCSAGIAATALIGDVDSASAALPLIAVVLALISGIFVGVDQLPSWLADVARVFPVYHLTSGLQTALGGGSFDAGNAAVLALWGVGGIAVAARRFRWEPQAVPA
jgi:ABC-2 type transport system permease protein